MNKNPVTDALTKMYFGMPLWAWIVVAVAVIALLVLIIALARSGKKRDVWEHGLHLRVADARWCADSLTLVVADRTKSAPEIARAWNDGVSRMATLSQQLYELATLAPSVKRAQVPQQLAIAIDNLRQALDADVRLRTSGYAPGQEHVIAQSAQVVALRRQELEALIIAARR
ncbi:MAG: hypothetical protein Q8P61_06020 [Candidatus Nanopelagicales bacterium]|nr:hypothetical protein [Candidatus Nanopelagicales bacterium]